MEVERKAQCPNCGKEIEAKVEELFSEIDNLKI